MADPVEEFRRKHREPAADDPVEDWRKWGTDWAEIFDELIVKDPAEDGLADPEPASSNEAD